MSVQTQINRLSTNVTNALTALAEKGVEVPTGANSDNLAELIAAIEAGATAVWGLITPASTDIITIEHNLGKRPVVWGMIATVIGVSAAAGAMGAQINVRQNVQTGELINKSTNFSCLASNKTSSYCKPGETTVDFFDTTEISDISKVSGMYSINKNYFKFKPETYYFQDYATVGETYVWFVLGMD